MAQTKSTYDPEADREPVHHRSPAEEQELHDFRQAMGFSPEDESRMDDNAVHDGEDPEKSLFKPNDDGAASKDKDKSSGKGGAVAGAAAGEGLFHEEDSKLSKRKKARSALKKLTQKKSLMVAGGGGGVVAIAVIFGLLFASSLKIPSLSANILGYEFARLTRQYGDNATQVSDEEIGIESIDNAKELPLLQGVYDKAGEMWSKFDDYRPSQVMKQLGVDNDLQLTVSPKGGITGTLDDVPFSMADQNLNRYIPGIGTATGFSNQVQFSREFVPALEDALEVNEVGPIMRAYVANNIRQELGISLIAWQVGKFQGKNDAQARLLEEQQKINDVDGGDTPPVAADDFDEDLGNAVNDASAAATTAEEDDTPGDAAGLQGIINNGGIINGVTTAVGNAVAATPLQDILNTVNPIAAFATPACIIFDGSLDNSGGSIDNQTKQQQAAFYYIATAADQQKAGSNYSLDPNGDGLDRAVGAANEDVGDITESNAYIRASGGTVNTQNLVSAESSADGEFTFFDAIPGLSSIPLVLPFLNGTAETFCPVVTNLGVQIAIGLGTILVHFIPGVNLADQGGQTALDTAGTELENTVVKTEAEDLSANLVTQDVITKTLSTPTKIKLMIFGAAKNAGATIGLTVLAKLIVEQRAGAVNSGTAQGTDLANEADAGGNIQANELERTQLFGRPLTEDEVCSSNQDDQAFIVATASKESAFNRYLAPSNTNSLLDRTAIAMGGQFNGSLGSTMVRLSSDLLHPMSLFGSLSSLIFGRTLAASNCDDAATDYGNVQFGWSDAEESIVKSDTSYNPIENEQIVVSSGQEAAIAAKYAVCFGYTYSPNGDGSFDPTDKNGDLQLADGPGDAASLGTLLSSDGMNGKPEYIERDSDGNVIDDPTKALCSPSNLDQDNSTYGPDMVLRWRLNMEDDTTIDQLTNMQTVTD